jgi:hypothetical protein
VWREVGRVRWIGKLTPRALVDAGLSTVRQRSARRVVPRLSTADPTRVDLGLRVLALLWIAARGCPADVPASWA